MKRWIFASIFVWTLISAVAYAGYQDYRAANTDEPDMPAAKAGQKIAWATDFESAMRQAKTEKKPLFVAFETESCTWCKKMERTTYVDPQVVAQMSRWVTVKIDGEKRPDVAQAYGVSAFPTVIMAQNSGKPFGMQDGYIKPAEFTSVLKRAYGDYQKLGA